MKVGDKIKEIIDSSGMTRVEFADKIGVSKQTLYKYEKGIIKNIPPDTILRIAKVGNILPAALMGWVSPEPEGLIDYYDESITKIEQLLSNSGYVVHLENYSFSPLVIIEKSNKFEKPQVFAVYESDLLSKYEQLRIECENVSAEDLIANTVASTTLLSSDEEQLLYNYHKLNNIGKSKAQEDIEDLTMLPKYTYADNVTYINAAHQRTDIPYNDEDQKFDNDIMDDDNF